MENKEIKKWEVIAEILSKAKKYAKEEGGSQGVLNIIYLDQYIKKCASPEKIKINHNFLSQFHEEKEEHADPKYRVRTHMKNTFKPFLKKFFETAGKDLPYEVTIKKGNYDEIELISRPVNKEASYGRSDKRQGDASNNEDDKIIFDVDLTKRYLKFPNKPIFVASVAFFIALIFVVIGAFFSQYSQSTDRYFALTILFTLLAGFPTTIGVTSLLVKRKLFRHALWDKFLRFSEEAIILASYYSTCPCPDCKGKVQLTKLWHKEGNRGWYTAICQRTPDLHHFKFNPTTFIGKMIGGCD